MKNIEKYINQSDTDLIDECRRGNEMAKTCLIKGYRHIIVYKAKRYAYQLTGIDDFSLGGFSGLYASSNTLTTNQQASYAPLIAIRIERKLTSYLRKPTTASTPRPRQASSLDEQPPLTEARPGRPW